MRYKVIHKERYVLNDSVRIFDSFKKFKEAYPDPTMCYDEGISKEVNGLKIAESVQFDYDHYVVLNVTVLE